MSTLNCSNCNASLPIDSDEKYLICEYCGSTNINPFATENHTETFIKETVKNGDAFIALKDYKNALDTFKTLSLEHPSDYRGHWGVVKVLTKNFSDFYIENSDFNEANKYFEKAQITATQKQKGKLENTWNGYCKNRQKHLADKKKATDELAEKKHQEALKKLKAEEKRLAEEKRKNAIHRTVEIIIFGIFIIVNALHLINLIKHSINDISFTDEYTNLVSILLWLGINILIASMVAPIIKSKLCALLPAILAIVHCLYVWGAETCFAFNDCCVAGNDPIAFPFLVVIFAAFCAIPAAIGFGISALIHWIVKKVKGE